MNSSLADEVQEAHERISPWVIETPLVPALELGLGNERVFFKLETVQVTHSFKVRGAFSKMTRLSADERQCGVVAASSGNHGAGVAYGAAKLSTRALIFVPETAEKEKVERIRNLGGEVIVTGDDCVEAERAARAHGEANRMTYISPYNDRDVIAGQGTIGLEILKALPSPDAVIVSVGGGGMIGGIGSVIRRACPDARIIAASPINSPALHEAMKVGHPVADATNLPTWSDATAGGIEDGAITISLCQEFVTDSVLCTESEIEAACRILLLQGHHLVEGAAGLAYAAYVQKKDELKGLSVAIVLCGASINHTRINTLLHASS